MFYGTGGADPAEALCHPTDMMDLLGHRNTRTTQIYVHVGKRNRHKPMEVTSL